MSGPAYIGSMDFRRARAVIALAIALALAACDGGRATPVDAPVPSSADPAGAGGLTESLRLALGDFLTSSGGGFELSNAGLVDTVRVLKLTVVDGRAYFLAAVGDAGAETRVFARADRSLGFWRVVEAQAPEDWSQLPEVGSNDFFFQEMGGERAAAGGFVDPTATRVDTVTASGTVLDEDVPRAGGAIVRVVPWGVLRVYRGEEVVGATPIIPERAQTEQPPLDADSQAVADRFTTGMLRGPWHRAAPHVTSDSLPGLWLPQIQAILTSSESTLVGRAPSDASRYTYGLLSETGRAILSVEMTREASGWRVGSCFYRRLPPEDG